MNTLLILLLVSKTCPVCAEKGMKSTVQEPMYGVRTLMCPSPGYWDENGNHHYGHDPNYTTYEYECSNGHAWKETDRDTTPVITDTTTETPWWIVPDSCARTGDWQVGDSLFLGDYFLNFVVDTTCVINFQPAKTTFWQRLRWLFTGRL